MMSRIDLTPTLIAIKEALANIMNQDKSKTTHQPKSTLDKQHGGTHYKTMALQPIEYGQANRMNPMEYSAIKYISRHAAKAADKGEDSGIQDICKAIHFCEMILEHEYHLTPDEITQELLRDAPPSISSSNQLDSSPVQESSSLSPSSPTPEPTPEPTPPTPGEVDASKARRSTFLGWMLKEAPLGRSGIILMEEELPGLLKITQERLRHFIEFNYDEYVDDNYTDHELIRACISYLDHIIKEETNSTQRKIVNFPWADENDLRLKTDDPLRLLRVVGALVAAEIDRRVRAIANSKG